jgi:hypothetical protein
MRFYHRPGYVVLIFDGPMAGWRGRLACDSGLEPYLFGPAVPRRQPISTTSQIESATAANARMYCGTVPAAPQSMQLSRSVDAPAGAEPKVEQIFHGARHANAPQTRLRQCVARKRIGVQGRLRPSERDVGPEVLLQNG